MGRDVTIGRVKRLEGALRARLHVPQFVHHDVFVDGNPVATSLAPPVFIHKCLHVLTDGITDHRNGIGRSTEN